MPPAPEAAPAKKIPMGGQVFLHFSHFILRSSFVAAYKINLTNGDSRKMKTRLKDFNRNGLERVNNPLKFQRNRPLWLLAKSATIRTKPVIYDWRERGSQLFERTHQRY